MCMYLFLLCIVFACEVCTVMVNNNNNKMAPVTPCQVTILDRNYRFAKAFDTLRIIVDTQIIELTENPAHAKAPYWLYG